MEFCTSAVSSDSHVVLSQHLLRFLFCYQIKPYQIHKDCTMYITGRHCTTTTYNADWLTYMKGSSACSECPCAEWESGRGMSGRGQCGRGQPRSAEAAYDFCVEPLQPQTLLDTHTHTHTHTHTYTQWNKQADRTLARFVAEQGCEIPLATKITRGVVTHFYFVIQSNILNNAADN